MSDVLYSCLRNVVATFHVLEKELKWRREHGKVAGFDGMTKFKPLVAVGAQEPLFDRVENADYFRKSPPSFNVTNIALTFVSRWHRRTWWHPYYSKHVWYTGDVHSMTRR
jgi:hypothetical protein